MTAWIPTKLADIAETSSGGTPDRKNADYFGGVIPWVKSGELEDNHISSTEETITELGLRNSSAKLLPAGTLLMAMYGATVGKTAILRITAATNQAVCAIKPKKELADIEFLRYALIHDRPEILKQRYGGAQPNISQQIIRNLSISLPSVTEQRQIADVLALVQRAIEQQQRLVSLSVELEKTLLHQLFTHGLRNEPQKETELGPIPQSWNVVYFSDFVRITNGQVDPRDSPYREMLHVGPENIEAETGYLMSLYTNGALGVRSGNYLFSSENVLYSKIRPYLRKAARPDFSGTCSADMYPLRPKDNRLIRNFLFHLLLSEQFSKQAISFQDRTGIPKINRQQLGRIQIPLPSVEEQTDIADALDVVNSKLGIHRQKQLTLTALFRSLIHELMTARIRVNDLDL